MGDCRLPHTPPQNGCLIRTRVAVPRSSQRYAVLFVGVAADAPARREVIAVIFEVESLCPVPSMGADGVPNLAASANEASAAVRGPCSALINNQPAEQFNQSPLLGSADIAR